MMPVSTLTQNIFFQLKIFVRHTVCRPKIMFINMCLRAIFNVSTRNKQNNLMFIHMYVS